MKAVAFLTSALALFLLSGCQAKPTKVYRFPGPSPEIYFTVEVWEDDGAISSDFTKVLVNLVQDNATDKQLVVDGPYILVSKIQWSDKNTARLCLTGGRVNSFKEKTFLNAGKAHYEIINSLSCNCIVTATSDNISGSKRQ